MDFPSRYIEETVAEFTKLPGIGKKTALRLTLHLLKQSVTEVERFGETVINMRKNIKFCKICHNVSDEEICNICSNRSRNEALICVVEGLREVIAIENTRQYNGLYHVTGGVISPIDGVGPENLNIETLIERVKTGKVEELIMALSPTMEGDTTIFYISKKLKDLPVKISTIARGIAFGGELEYVDEFTLARSIATRLPYENYLLSK
ncbi:MAG TPA: recombination mediator RecR [Chitinophagales bacterium]|nr:recombination mediator RecR [Chitinophagales bacterium]HRK26951.1 recombination mediator RecR [Chitinophagales bacterium]